MATIVLKLGDRELQKLGIVKTRTSIGRDSGCDLSIDNEGISRVHAFVDFENGAFKLYDNRSANGVFVGSRRVREVNLANGAKIRLGKFTLVFLDVGGMPVEQLRATDIELDDYAFSGGATHHLDENYMRQMRDRLEQRERDRRQPNRPATKPVVVARPTRPKSGRGLWLVLIGVAIGIVAVGLGFFIFTRFGG